VLQAERLWGYFLCVLFNDAVSLWSVLWKCDQWRLVAKISGGAAPENCIFFENWGMATDIKLKDYILYKYKERIKEKRTNYIIRYR
jgi:hypothetical protein